MERHLQTHSPHPRSTQAPPSAGRPQPRPCYLQDVLSRVEPRGAAAHHADPWRRGTRGQPAPETCGGRRDRAGDAGQAAGSPPRTHPAARTHAGGGRHRLAGGGVQPAAAFSVPIYPRRNRPEAVAAPPPPARGLGILGAAPLTPSRRPPRHPGLFHRAPGPAARAVPVPRSPAAPRAAPLPPATPPARTAWSHPACRLPVGQWRGGT